MVSQTSVLVVGAGPTGLLLALWLARSGVSVRVIDQRAGVQQESRALDVQARTLEHYRQLGLAERLVERGVRVRRLCVREHGRAVTSSDVTDLGRGLSPYPFILCCPQDDHEALLAQELAAAGVRVEWQTTLVQVSQEGDSVTATLATPGAALQLIRPSYVCGCDGTLSTVRESLRVPYAGSTSEHRYFVADVAATGPAAASSSEGVFSFCLSRRDFMLVVPARPDGSHRVIGLVPRDLAGRETLTFADLRPTIEQTTDLRVRSVGWFSTYRVSHRVANTFRVGRVFLLGDAAHVHSPLGGQGMNTGIADAVNLGWKLAAVLDGRAGAALLDSYEPERMAFARRLVATTDRLFGLVAGPGPGRRLARQLLLRVLLPAALAVPVTQQALIGRIAQIRTSYRASALSLGRSGGVHGGDRLPWVEFGNGTDNYDALSTLDWQLHGYGSLPHGQRSTAEQLGVAVHQFDWTDGCRAAGLRRGAGYLVRPDGYVAVVDAGARGDEVRRLLTAFSICPRR